MNPPSEQLIRDYLNRLSLAAKSRLEPRDRQALLDHTRARIEAEAGDLGRATSAQVRRILAAVGDPIAIAENERARAAAPRDPAAASRATGAARQIWPPPGVLAIGYRPAGFTASIPPLTRPAMQPVQPRLANLPVPPGGSGYPGNDSSVSGSTPSAPSGLPSQRAPHGLPTPGVPPAVPAPRESPAAGNSAPVGSPLRASSQLGGSPVSDNSHTRSGEPAPPAEGSEQDMDGQKTAPGLEGTGHSRLDDEDQPGVEPDVELVAPVVYEEAGPSWLSQRAGAAAGGLMRFGSALVAIAVRAPLETLAVLVLGIGAAIYPPAWLIGALIAVISRKWDLRDKWVGLATPLVVAIFGATLAIVLGGQQTSYGSYAFEAWLAAGRLSRIAAVLSASYLLWRVYKGPRDPRRPPWSVPRPR
jgi:hypothetical protein